MQYCIVIEIKCAWALGNTLDFLDLGGRILIKMGHMYLAYYVNKMDVGMREKSAWYMILQWRYDNAKTWDTDLAKQDH